MVGTSRVRPTLAVVLPFVVLAIEIVAGVYTYANPKDDLTAILAAAGGIAALAAIDVWLRPREDAEGAERMRWFLPYWALIPFLCAISASSWLHYQKWNQSLGDVVGVAKDLRPYYADKDGVWNEHVTTEAIDATIDVLVIDRFKGEAAKSDEARQFSEIARVVGHDLKRQKGDIKNLVAAAREDTFIGFGLAIVVQAVFVLWVPLLLAVAIARARRRLCHRRSHRAGWAQMPQDQRDFLDALEMRDKRILAEDRAVFFLRFCFGAMLVLGTTYIFAPYGLKATYLMSLVDEHALPGHTSFTLWSTSFASAPVIVVGFVGYLLYAVITATQRFVQDDLDDQAMLSLFVRGLVVILLSLALGSSDINETLARLFVFVAGVFPLRALEAIAKKVNIAIDPDFGSAAPSFEGLPSLDTVKVFALRSAGIESTYDLAAIKIEEIAQRVRIDPRLLGHAVDRAILIEAVGQQMVKDLEPFAIGTATELVDLRDDMPHEVTEKFGDAPKRVAQRLANDPRVAKIRWWLAGAPGGTGGDRSG